MDGVSRPRPPAHLRVVPESSPPEREPATGAPVSEAAPGEQMPSEHAVAAAGRLADLEALSRSGEEMCPCPCACSCGQVTARTNAWAARHPWMATLQRCGVCQGAGHVPTSPGRAKGAPASSRRTFRSHPEREAWEVEADARAARELREEREAAARARFQASVPMKFAQARLDERVHPANAAAVRQRLQLLRAGKPGGALIFGEPGMGKTWLAYAYVHAALDEGLLRPWEVLHGSELSLLSPVHETSSSFPDKAAAKARLLGGRTRLWLINDVGRAGNIPEIDRRALWDTLTDKVWSEGLSLVITTNLKSGTPPDVTDGAFLAGWLGQAAYSRISTGAGRGNVAVPSGRDMRREIHLQDMQDVFTGG